MRTTGAAAARHHGADGSCSRGCTPACSTAAARCGSSTSSKGWPMAGSASIPGAPLGGRRPGRGGDGQQRVRPDARRPLREAAARASQQPLPAGRGRAAGRRGQQPAAAGAAVLPSPPLASRGSLQRKTDRLGASARHRTGHAAEDGAAHALQHLHHQPARLCRRVAAAGRGQGHRQGAWRVVNDMVLWLCSTALRGYLAEGRELLADKTLVAGVPISLRAEATPAATTRSRAR